MAGKLFAAFFIIAVFAFMSSVSGQSLEVIPPVHLARPGESVSILCKSSNPIKICSFKVPGYVSMFLTPDSPSPPGRKYYGKGLEYGDCGLTLESVKDENNGIVNCSVNSNSGFDSITSQMSLIVARTPSLPTMFTNQGSERDGSFKAGDTLSVMCVVRDARPFVNITWYIDDSILMDGVTAPRISEDPSLSTLYTTSQNLTRRLHISDNGRVIKCVTQHPTADPTTHLRKLPLVIKFKPEPLEDPISIFGIKTGETGVINVTIQANPKPVVQWVLNGETVHEGNSDRFNRIEASLPVALGGNYYNVTLNILDIAKEDTEREYLLRASNEIGLTEYHVRISTLDQPEGTKLGPGEIIGIVITVLVILIAMFLIIFAKATNRWCFGDGVTRRSTSKHAGETSDTESVEVSHLSPPRTEQQTHNEPPPVPKESPLSKINILPKSINFKALLPGGNKNKDKVSQAELQEPNVASIQEEEAKPLQIKTGASQNQGLIYAELSLKSSPEPQPLTQEATEYAEIVYNKDPVENKNQPTAEK